MNNIYIAGRFEAAPRLRRERTALQRLGHTVTSSWLDEALDTDPVVSAKRDLEDVRRSQVLILDTLDEDDRGGREVEFGDALNVKTCIIVGPERNIFHKLADLHFHNWPALLNWCWGEGLPETEGIPR